jgi:branched-chain amino acid transport system permease protein
MADKLPGALIIAALALVPVIAGALGEGFYITLSLRILVFALAAIGLNLILGFAGLVSFGHALYIGIGAYAVGVLSSHGIVNGWAHLGAGMLVGAICALLVGITCLRTTGMAFIMITLAFAQMFYFLAVGLKQYGGDEGISLAQRSEFWPISIVSTEALYYSALLIVLLALCFCRIGSSNPGSAWSFRVRGLTIKGCARSDFPPYDIGSPPTFCRLSFAS